MNRGIKRKIFWSTTIGAGMSIFFGFAVNDYELYRAWILGVICLMVLIFIGNSNSKEESYYEKNMQIMESKTENQLQKELATTKTLKQMNRKIEEGNLEGAKERKDFLSDVKDA